MIRKIFVPLLAVFIIFAIGYSLPGFYEKTNTSPYRETNDNSKIKSGNSYDLMTPLIESFEMPVFPPLGWVKYKAGTSVDSGWRRLTVGTFPIPGWTGGVITAPPGGGNAVAFVTYNQGTGVNREWLVTPRIINVQPNDSLKFWRKFWPMNVYSDTLSIKISKTTNLQPAFNIEVARIAFPRNSTDTDWVQHKYRLGNFVNPGDSIYIAFIEHINDNFNDGATVSLDLVQITGNIAVGIDETNETPEKYILSQNYPNPFNPSTTVRFTLPHPDNVKLAVYDMLGKEVEVIINGYQTAGTHSILFDASALSGGIYLYTLKGKNYTDTKRMLLVK